jgi:hypothetical protein
MPRRQVGFYPFWALIEGLVFFAEGRLAASVLFLIGTAYFAVPLPHRAWPGARRFYTRAWTGSAWFGSAGTAGGGEASPV